LLIDAFSRVRDKKDFEDLITRSLTSVLKRSLSLEREDQIAVSQEFKEWINGVAKEEDIWIVNNQIN
tara:strand:+ start:152 stop:352 length:201 start_codon:yes stop_codon:yes gene_type:complete